LLGVSWIHLSSEVLKVLEDPPSLEGQLDVLPEAWAVELDPNFLEDIASLFQ
jgi:hypothetical protein